MLAAAWTGAEWVRGTILTGFPWDLIGYVWTVSGAMLQLAAVTGIYGLSLATVAAAAMPAVLAVARPSRREWLAVAAVAAMLAAIWVAGSLRLEVAQRGDVSGIRLRIVQPDIAQTESGRPTNRGNNSNGCSRFPRCRPKSP
jgi:apolipoprotein N-acyltransferase